jgi:hypothetical protein
MIVKSTYHAPSQENVKKLIEYLFSISGKKLSIDFIRQNILKFKGIKNFKTVGRCHLQAAAIYLDHLISHLLPRDYEGSVEATIAEVIPIIREFDPEEDCSFVLISTNTLPSTLHYRQAHWIFYKNTFPEEANSRYQVDILVLYDLRLSLEKRILGFLGLESIIIKGKPVPLSALIFVVSQLKNIEYHPDIKWENISKANDFLNFYMHRHRRPFPWTIHQVFEIFNPLIKSGRHEDGGVIYGSAYSSTFVRDEKKLQKEIEESLSSKFPGVDLKWRHSRDILITKQNGNLGKI